jgi:hypothetical protein
MEQLEGGRDHRGQHRLAVFLDRLLAELCLATTAERRHQPSGRQTPGKSKEK